MINAGGSQIPVYALALGLAGGYLRYLYDTWRNRYEIIGELDKIKNEVFDSDHNFYPEKPKREPAIFTGVRKYFVGKPTEPDETEREKFENERKNLKEIGRRQRHFYLFEVLKRVGLVLLSPLLASAMWLFLSQVGFQNQNIVLGAVSFSIGLVTEEAVKSIIKLATRIFGAAEEAGTAQG